LVYGRTVDGKPILVCAVPKHIDMLIIITVYVPSENEWIDFRERRK